MDARDNLIERIARGINPQIYGASDEALQRIAEAALSVIETATSTCPECGGTGSVSDPEGFENDADEVVNLPCPSCSGQPGPLLILEALGAQLVQVSGSARYPEGSLTIGEFEAWRFPRRQEGQ